MREITENKPINELKVGETTFYGNKEFRLKRVRRSVFILQKVIVGTEISTTDHARWGNLAEISHDLKMALMAGYLPSEKCPIF